MPGTLIPNKMHIPRRLLKTSAQVDTPAVTVAGQLTMAAPGDGYRNVIESIIVSYKGGTPVSTLSITSGGSVVFSIDISTPGVHTFTRGEDMAWVFGENEETVIDASAPGAGVTLKLNMDSWVEQII